MAQNTGAELGGEALNALISWIVQGNANSSSRNALGGGLQNAQDSITKAYDEANSWVSPYAKAGMQDFNNYRNAAYGGYFDQPYGETYQPLQFQNQGFQAGQFNPQTQSYGSSFQPFQAPAQGPISQPRLPSMGSMPHDPLSQQAPPQGPQRQGGGGMTADQLVELIRGMSKQQLPLQPGGIYNRGEQQMQSQMPNTMQNNPYKGQQNWAVNRQPSLGLGGGGMPGRSGPYG